MLRARAGKAELCHGDRTEPYCATTDHEEIDLNSLGAWCPHRGAEDRLTVELALRIVLRTLIKGSKVL